jgi:hypothetical protein
MTFYNSYPENVFNARYNGGHLMYPQPTDTKVLIFHDGFEVEKLGIYVPYSAVKNVENKTAREVKSWHVGILGPFAADRIAPMHIYTIIHFIDDLRQIQRMVFDFGKRINEAQSIIYRRSVEASQAQQRRLPNQSPIPQRRLPNQSPVLHRRFTQPPPATNISRNIQKLCSNCQGSGKISCASCKGKRRTTCRFCLGQGGKYEYDNFTKSSRWRYCGFCSNGSTSCNSCGGSGNQKCYTCMGTGKLIY